MDWQSLDWQTQVSVALIAIAAVVIAIGIIKMRELFTATPLVAERSQRFIIRSLKINRQLMIFFLVGYIAVAVGLLLGKTMLSVLSMGVIFFLGALFVYLGITIHARMIAEIQQTIQGLVPICMECKKVRRTGGDSSAQADWKEIETYISQRTDARFSHGICPECLHNVRSKR